MEVNSQLHAQTAILLGNSSRYQMNRSMCRSQAGLEAVENGEISVQSRRGSSRNEEGHKVCWNEARILQIEIESRYRKYKQSAIMACVTYPASLLYLEISSIRIPLARNEGCNLC
jgi:hypothetical protein